MCSSDLPSLATVSAPDDGAGWTWSARGRPCGCSLRRSNQGDRFRIAPPSGAALRRGSLGGGLGSWPCFATLPLLPLVRHSPVLKAIYPLEVRTGGHVFAAFASFLLLTLAANLLRRKRVAWLLIC